MSGDRPRETKTKAVKKKGGKRRDDDCEDEEQQPLPHLQRQAALAERVPVVW